MRRSSFIALSKSICLAGLAATTVAAAAAPVVRSEAIGQSVGGRPIEVFTIAREDQAGRSPHNRPALVVIAGVQGHHKIGARVAESLAGLLIEEHAESLAGRTVYVIPRVNPDGLARFMSVESPKALSGRAPEPGDADRDRRIDDDPPNDLNGDGYITMMRIPAPNGGYDLEATHVIDTDDPRLMRGPRGDELATHALLIEGVDDDGDGRFNEDGRGGAAGGGVDLDMHFPTHWPEHADGAGRFPLARPEAKALVDWLQSRGNIAAVIVLGPHDTVTTTPPTGEFGPARKVPLGIEADDAAAYQEAAEAFGDITGISSTEPGPNRAGSLVQWCYADLGVYAFGTPVWVRPDLVEADTSETDADEPAESEGKPDADAAGKAPTPEQIEAADRADLADRGVDEMFIDVLYMDSDERAVLLADVEAMNQAELADLMQRFAAAPADVQDRVTAVRMGGDDPGPRPEVLASINAAASGDSTRAESSPAGSPDAKWLAWIDENGIDGFVEWQPVEHPQLGPVEVGGFVPGVRVNPPSAEEDRLNRQQAAFAASVLEMLPELSIDSPVVERVSAGLWRVSVQMRNSGTLPTSSAIGVKARRVPGVVCVLDPALALESEQIVSGPRTVRFDAIDGRGSTERAEWLVVAGQGDRVVVEVRSPLIGATRHEITMETQQ